MDAEAQTVGLGETHAAANLRGPSLPVTDCHIPEGCLGWSAVVRFRFVASGVHPKHENDHNQPRLAARRPT